MSLKLTIALILYRLKGLFEDPVELFKKLGVESGDRILEIGCAIGYHTLPLAEIASEGQVFAIDIWEEGLRHLEGKIRPGQNIETICCSAEAIDLPASSLDKVVCFDTLHDVTNFEHAIEKWVEFLKKGGWLYYRDPMMPPEKIQTLSRGKLRQVRTVKGIHIFMLQ